MYILIEKYICVFGTFSIKIYLTAMLLINLFILCCYLIMAQTTINHIKTLPINDRTNDI